MPIPYLQLTADLFSELKRQDLPRAHEELSQLLSETLLEDSPDLLVASRTWSLGMLSTKTQCCAFVHTGTKGIQRGLLDSSLRPIGKSEQDTIDILISGSYAAASESSA